MAAADGAIAAVGGPARTAGGGPIRTAGGGPGSPMGGTPRPWDLADTTASTTKATTKGPNFFITGSLPLGRIFQTAAEASLLHRP